MGTQTKKEKTFQREFDNTFANIMSSAEEPQDCGGCGTTCCTDEFYRTTKKKAARLRNRGYQTSKNGIWLCTNCALAERMIEDTETF